MVRGYDVGAHGAGGDGEHIPYLADGLGGFVDELCDRFGVELYDLGVGGIEVCAEEGLVFASGLPDVPGEPDLVPQRNGHFEQKPELTGGRYELAVYVHGQLGLGDEGSLDANLIDEGGKGAVVSQDDLGTGVVDVGAEGAGLGAAAGDLLFFEEKNVAVTQSVGGGKTGEAASHNDHIQEGVGGDWRIRRHEARRRVPSPTRGERVVRRVWRLPGRRSRCSRRSSVCGPWAA